MLGMNRSTAINVKKGAAPYPQLSVGTGLLTAFILLLFSVFIIGIQAYVLVSYSQKYGEETVNVTNSAAAQDVTGGKAWGDTYNGIALASASTCVLISFYIFVTLQQRNGNLLRLGAVLMIVGAAISAASTVITSLASERINSADIHPCSGQKNTNNNPQLAVDCTTWFALEVTVSVLSGLNFCLCFVIFSVIIAGLSDDGSTSQQMTTTNGISSAATHDDQQTHLEATEAAKVNRALSDRRPMVGDPNWNTMYKRHLQQVIVQQKMRQQYPSTPPPQPPPLPSTGADSRQQQLQPQRGKLQELHKERLLFRNSSNASNNSSNYSRPMSRQNSDNNNNKQIKKVEEVNKLSAMNSSPQKQQQIDYNNLYQKELLREMDRRQRLQSSEVQRY